MQRFPGAHSRPTPGQRLPTYTSFGSLCLPGEVSTLPLPGPLMLTLPAKRGKRMSRSVSLALFYMVPPPTHPGNLQMPALLSSFSHSRFSCVTISLALLSFLLFVPNPQTLHPHCEQWCELVQKFLPAPSKAHVKLASALCLLSLVPMRSLTSHFLCILNGIKERSPQ